MAKVEKQKITPFLWFNNNAEDAANYYCSIFKNSGIGSVSRYGEGAPMPKGTAMVVPFSLEGQNFLALNGGPVFQFTEAVSFVVNCENQEEIDWFWEKLSAGGKEIECGWLKDKFGLSWQIVPTVLGELMSSGNSKSSQRVMQALWKMKKLDIQKLQEAYGQ
ncbi:MAG TPA: VOC family protein [Bacteroidia bacterium]